jgi:hypothetical protein
MTGHRSIFFGFATPETVLTIVSGEISTRNHDGARRADLAGARLTSDSPLGSFAGDAEKEIRAAFACCFVHPRWALRIYNE